MPEETPNESSAHDNQPSPETPQGSSDGQKKKRRRRRRRKPAGDRTASTESTESSSPDSDSSPRKRRTGKDLAAATPSKRPSRRDKRPSNKPDREGRLESTAEDAKVVRQRNVRDSSNEDIFDQDKGFADLGLGDVLLEQLKVLKFDRPTHIQSQIIPHIVQGKDVIGQAKTGTGKTAAFGLPLLQLVTPGEDFQALILAPTRELAIQIHKELEELGFKSHIRSIPVYGGQKITTQADKLAKGAEIIVGTPGRIMDMQRRGYLSFNNFKFVVLDEVDRMLDVGFRQDIKHILGLCPKKRQTVFVSATVSDEIERLARSYMHNPEKIVTSAGSLTASLVKQYYLSVQPWDKKSLLLHLLTHEEPDLTLIFCRLKRVVDELAKTLSQKGIEAHAIHADLTQGKRNQVMEKLRAGHLSVLIASDLAARGIDVEGISHVINYDLPEDIELYVHRIGRTARAGSGGTAWSFVTPEQGPLLTAIENHINTEIPQLEYKDFKPGTPPPDYLEQEARRKARLEETLARGNRFQVGEQPVVEAEASPEKFPGGIIPTKRPPKTLGGRIRSSRRG
ncbi:MAG TPA: DEAD/DEAH box helicase [Phycisphaerales bacterium]|nr:DEAD/DEAH box helicase [Phycisphaerales bacterium]